MTATIINCLTVIIGSLIGLIFHARIKDSIKEVVFISAGFISLLVGFRMALGSQSYLIVLFSIGVGGVIGYLINIEGGILRLGSFFERVVKRGRKDTSLTASKDFALGFLNASVLFCVGAMTIVGAIKAGAEGDYELILIKSVMDGFMAIMFTAAYGIGVIFSAVTILVYQGAFTLAGAWLAPHIGEAGLIELSAVGGVLVIMIGINLLNLREIKTSNFLPALLLVPLLTTVSPWVTEIFNSIIH
ncbi:MAG: DUF554 domain-containing protein [Spirochaetales bacterium]|nr:DUF554 domain-containing protein [Spirochaetales bacterium]